MQRYARPGCYIAAALFIVAGALHFLIPQFYLKIMPPYLPWHLALVQVSGFFEIAGGVGLLLPPARRAAAWGLIALLLAVFPANIYAATDLLSIPAWIRWGRLPLQFLLIWWMWLYTRPAARRFLP